MAASDVCAPPRLPVGDAFLVIVTAAGRSRAASARIKCVSTSSYT